MVKRYSVIETLKGGTFGYGVEDVLSSSPWPHRFNLSLKEAEEYCDNINEKKGWRLGWIESLFYSENHVNKIKEALKYEE